MSLRRCMGCMSETENVVCEKCGYPADFRNEPHQLPVGTLLRGQYVVGRVLGQGGFGITYLGWDSYLDIPVAIKEYYPNTMVNRECTQSLSVHCYTEAVRPGYVTSKERFLREAKALAKFEDQPCIVRIKSFFPENETAYIVMEYVKGTDLAKYVSIRGGRLQAEEVLRILKPVMEALEEVHKAGLVHRDISPDNIVLHPKGGAKLLDFGAVRSVENADTEKALARSTEAILKHGFAPMEQYQNRGSLGPWTDVYALCATIFYCLTGTIPEDAPARMMEERDPDWSSIPGLSPAQRTALEKGMALRAKNRIGSVAELMKALYGPEEIPIGSAQVPAPREPEKPAVIPERKPEPKPKPSVPEKKPGAKKPERKKLRSRILLSLAALLLVAAAAFCLTAKKGWYREDGKWTFYTWPGTRKTASWHQQEGRCYYFDENGFLHNGWLNWDGRWYYFGSDGAMISGWRNIEDRLYYFGTDGVMVTGWQKIGGDWYHFMANGRCCIGWQKIGKFLYCFDEQGRMLTGGKTVNGVTYHFREDGVLCLKGRNGIDGKHYYFEEDYSLRTGWYESYGRYYYYGSDGAALPGWQTIGEKTYYFFSDGRMKTGWHEENEGTYFLGMDGAMVTGWLHLGGSYYYFDQDGLMHRAWLELGDDTYYFGLDGIMYTGRRWILGKYYSFDETGKLLSKK